MLLFSCSEKKEIPKKEAPEEVVAPIKEDAKIEHTPTKKVLPKTKKHPPERAIKKKQKSVVADTLRPKTA